MPEQKRQSQRIQSAARDGGGPPALAGVDEAPARALLGAFSGVPVFFGMTYSGFALLPPGQAGTSLARRAPKVTVTREPVSLCQNKCYPLALVLGWLLSSSGGYPDCQPHLPQGRWSGAVRRVSASPRSVTGPAGGPPGRLGFCLPFNHGGDGSHRWFSSSAPPPASRRMD